MALLIAYALAVGIASLAPGPRAWGIHSAGFLETPARAAVLALLALASCLSLVPWRAFRKKLALATTPSWAKLLFFALWIAALWLLRDRTHFLGDGTLWVASLRGGALTAPAEPLARTIWEAASALLRAAGAPVATLALVSIACGAAAVALLWRLAREIGVEAETRVPAFLLLLTMGSSQLFFGYVESYPVVAVAVLATLCLGLREARRGTASPWLAIVYGLTVASHLMTLYLAPALLYVIARFGRSTGRRLLFIALILAFAAGTMTLCGSGPADWVHPFDVAARVARTGSDAGGLLLPYGVISVDHLVDILNELLLVLPVPLLLLLAAWRKGARLPRSPEGTVLALAAGAGLASLGLLVLPVAAAQDWDLGAILVLPLGVLGVRAGLPRIRSLRPLLPAALAGAGLASLLAFVLVNASPAAGTRRYETLVGPGARISDFGRWYAYESLAQHYRHQRRYERAMDYVEYLVRTAPSNPRYWGMGGEVLIGMGRYGEAVPMLQESLRRNPNRATARTNLGIAYSALGSYDQALEQFRFAVRLDGENPAYHHNLGLAFRNAGQPDSARAVWTELLRRWPGYTRARRALESLEAG